MSDHLVVERRDAIATVILNRPEIHNAINVATYGDLPDVVRDLDADPTVKVVVHPWRRQRSFASGADISEFEAERSDAVKAKAYNEKVAAAEHAIEELTKPSIAMIHGYCIGGGAGLALACDIRFADRRGEVRDHARQARAGLQPRVDQADGRPGRPVPRQVDPLQRAADPRRRAPTSSASSTRSSTPTTSRS